MFIIILSLFYSVKNDFSRGIKRVATGWTIFKGGASFRILGGGAVKTPGRGFLLILETNWPLLPIHGLIVHEFVNWATYYQNFLKAN